MVYMHKVAVDYKLSASQVLLSRLKRMFYWMSLVHRSASIRLIRLPFYREDERGVCSPAKAAVDP